MTEENYIEFSDFKLYYQFWRKKTHPDEPVLILLHDSWGCTELWEDFPEKLSALFGLNTLSYDRRGYGKSSPFQEEERTKNYLHEAAEELISVMDKMKIDRAILYGHSDGASIALIAAAVYPERFQGIMVEGAHSFVEEQGKNAVRESRDKARSNSLLKTLEKYHGDKAAELFRRWHIMWAEEDFFDWSIVSILKNISCPVLAFRGENDPFDTIEQLRVLEREIKSSVVTKVISNAAHTPRKENEKETLKLINHFLDNELMKNMSIY